MVVVIFFSIFCFFLSSSSTVFFVFVFLVVAVFEISRDDEAPLFAFFFSFADDDDDRSDGLPLLFPSLFFGVLEEEGDVPFSLALELVVAVLLSLLLLFNIFFFFSSLYVTKFTTHLLHPRAAYLHLEHPGGFTEGGDILTRALRVFVVKTRARSGK